MPARKERIDLEKLTPYHLGIIWALGTYIESDTTFVMRHKQLYFLDQISPYIESEPFFDASKNRFTLKTNMIDIDQLQDMGYSNRNAEKRSLPFLSEYRDFLRAYIELHGYIDYCTCYSRNRKKKYNRVRLRTYGNIKLMSQINDILVDDAWISKHKLQVSGNNKTACLAINKLEEFKDIIAYIEGEPYCPEWWDTADYFLAHPRITTLVK